MRYNIGDQVTVRTSNMTRYGVIVAPKGNRVPPIGCYIVKLRSADRRITVHLDYLQHLIGPVRPQDMVEVPSPHVSAPARQITKM